MSEALGSFFRPQSWRQTLRQKVSPEAVGGRPFRIADFFSGCGGLSLGAVLAAHASGRRPVIQLAVDNWLLATKVYQGNLGCYAKRVLCADVRDVVHEDVHGLDLLLAGPPCQGHSDLNNSTRRLDPRNELYLAPIEFAVRNLPRAVIIENVPSVVHSSENVTSRAKAALVSAGYGCFEAVVDVSNLGIPQKRRRHLLIAMHGVQSEELASVVGPIALQRKPPGVMSFVRDLQDRIDDSDPMLATTRISADNKARIEYLFSRDTYDLPNEYRPACHRDKNHSYVSMYGRMHPDKPAQTITSGFGSMGQGRFVHPTRPRMITAREAARIQGFPDYFSFSEVSSRSALRDMIANAVPPALSAAITSLMIARSSGRIGRKARLKLID